MTGPAVVGRFLSEGNGTPVVVLHPLGADAAFWQPMAAELPGRPVYAIDLPGHGGSPIPEQRYSIADVAGAIVEHLAAAGIARMHLVGLSIGGMIAQEIAAIVDGPTDRLVLAGTVPVYPEQWQQQWQDRAGLAASGRLSELLAPTLSLWLTEPTRAADGPAARYAAAALAAVDPAAYGLSCTALASADTRSVLEQIIAPTLVISGAADAPLFHQGAADLAEAISGTTTAEIPEAGHASALERPAAFAALVESHLPPVESAADR